MPLKKYYKIAIPILLLISISIWGILFFNKTLSTVADNKEEIKPFLDAFFESRGNVLLSGNIKDIEKYYDTANT
ncbi:MAG: hypothetical protein PWP67_3024, partial [Clostridium butyricum]|nr:hypothetical protein [Clostridium butyricum]